MDEPWSIPRASLGGSVSSSQSNSQNSSVKIHKNNKSTTSSLNRQHNNGGQSNRGYYSEGSESEYERQKQLKHQQRARQPSKTLAELQNKFEELKRIRGGSLDNGDGSGRGAGSSGDTGTPKRGSKSSQGSTDSNHSSHSASSGSLLLTAANLERFTQIHHNNKNSKKPSNTENSSKIVQHSHHNIHQQNYKNNITLPSAQQKSSSSNNNDSTTIAIDHNHLHHKTKDIDSVSLASSTHFTMVNGMHPQRNVKDGICSRGHQITILILSMSFVFLVGIIGMVYMLEMRAREMPKY